MRSPRSDRSSNLLACLDAVGYKFITRKNRGSAPRERNVSRGVKTMSAESFERSTVRAPSQVGASVTRPPPLVSRWTTAANGLPRHPRSAATIWEGSFSWTHLVGGPPRWRLCRPRRVQMVEGTKNRIWRTNEIITSTPPTMLIHSCAGSWVQGHLSWSGAPWRRTCGDGTIPPSEARYVTIGLPVARLSCTRSMAAR